MIICSVDIRGGRAVQLRQGRELVLTAPEDPRALVARFHRYGPVAVIDIDAAEGRGSNEELVLELCRVAPVRVGGGIRDEAKARRFLRAGAEAVIVGTALDALPGWRLPPERVIVALDHRGGTVRDRGWTGDTGEHVVARARRVAPLCREFLCTWIEREGGMGGMPLEEILRFAKTIPKPVIVAGGVRDTGEAVLLSKEGFDVQVGMSLYTGKLDPVAAVADSLRYDDRGLVATVVQDADGDVLMLAYSSRESLRLALAEGRGVYWSRSRGELWRKGDSSGHVQELVSCRADCDRDALLFTVRQTGPACHRNTGTCFGPRRFAVPRLLARLGDRIARGPEDSYVRTLAGSPSKLAGKLLEECHELLIASGRDASVWEAADALFHLMVVMAKKDVRWEDVERELAGRARSD